MTELVMNDIAKVEEESLIFRENTLATKAVEHFLRLVGMGYLHETLGMCRTYTECNMQYRTSSPLIIISCDVSIKLNIMTMIGIR